MSKRFLIGVLVSAVLLGLVLFKVDPKELRAAFGAADAGLLGVVAVLHLVVLCLKAVRWDVVLRALADEEEAGRGRDRRLVFDALFVGYFGNYVLPAKAGELARSGLYARRRGVPLTSVLATILFERFLDALTLVLFFQVVALLVPLPPSLPEWVVLSADLAGVAALMGLLTLFALWRFLPGGPLDVPDAAPFAPLLRRIAGLLAAFRRGLRVVSDRRRAVLAALWTVAIWGVECVAVFLCFRAFGSDLHWTGAVVQVVIASFAIAAPSAPGGLGIHQWVTLLVVAPFGVSGETAVSASLVLTFVVVLWVVPIGLFGLWRQGLAAADLRHDIEAARAAVRPPRDGALLET